ncbi:MAG: hypothetical protein EOM12_05485 [Verrucomicrobiae bacterium]|nr:hypothetical protein [Verrucomicrobiae bacterium]
MNNNSASEDEEMSEKFIDILKNYMKNTIIGIILIMVVNYTCGCLNTKVIQEDKVDMAILSQWYPSHREVCLSQDELGRVIVLLNKAIKNGKESYYFRSPDYMSDPPLDMIILTIRVFQRQDQRNFYFSSDGKLFDWKLSREDANELGEIITNAFDYR